MVRRVRHLKRQSEKSSEVISQAGMRQENRVAHQMGVFGFLFCLLTGLAMSTFSQVQ